MGQEGSSTPGSFSHPQRNILMMNFLIQPWEHGQGFWLQKDQWLVQCWAVWEGHAGTPGWWAQPEEGWQS